QTYRRLSVLGWCRSAHRSFDRKGSSAKSTEGQPTAGRGVREENENRLRVPGHSSVHLSPKRSSSLIHQTIEERSKVPPISEGIEVRFQENSSKRDGHGRFREWNCQAQPSSRWPTPQHSATGGLQTSSTGPGSGGRSRGYHAGEC
ncbi:hypothetical protein TCAL_10109, partial [Tigriopus californicus]